MNFEKNKCKYLFAAVLVLSLAVTMFALPAATAHTPPWTLTTYSYVSIAPNPVGVGQTAYVNFWIDKVPPTAEGNWGYMWHKMTVTVTKPDGTTETLGPFNSDAVGGTWASYVPSQVGTYKFVGHFPTQTVVIENPYPYQVGFVPIGTDFVNDTYTASTSKEVSLTVQQQQVQSAYPAAQLPTGYWQRPINSMNRDFSRIMKSE